MVDGNEDLWVDDLFGLVFESYEFMEFVCFVECSGYVVVSDGCYMFVWGGYKSN